MRHQTILPTPISEASVPGIVLVCDRKLRRVLY